MPHASNCTCRLNSQRCTNSTFDWLHIACKRAEGLDATSSITSPDRNTEATQKESAEVTTEGASQPQPDTSQGMLAGVSGAFSGAFGLFSGRNKDISSGVGLQRSYIKYTRRVNC